MNEGLRRLLLKGMGEADEILRNHVDKASTWAIDVSYQKERDRNSQRKD
jgi:hypothetical protein